MRSPFLFFILTLSACSMSNSFVDNRDGDTTYADADIPQDTFDDVDLPETIEDDADTDIESEEVSCWTMAPTRDGHLALIEIDMQTESSSEIARFDNEFDLVFRTTGIAYLDGRIITSSPGVDGTYFFEIDLENGNIRTLSGSSRNGLALYRNQLVNLCDMHPGGLCFFDSFDDLSTFSPSLVLDTEAYGSRIGVHGEEGYCALHSADVIDVIDMGTGELIRTVTLEAYDTWVWGISVAGGKLFLIDDGRGDYEDSEVHIVSFDPVSGLRQGDVVVDIPNLHTYTHSPTGLWCESPRPELP